MKVLKEGKNQSKKLKRIQQLEERLKNLNYKRPVSCKTENLFKRKINKIKNSLKYTEVEESKNFLR